MYAGRHNSNSGGSPRSAKRFFYVSAGLFLLVAAYSIGAHRADAQSGGQKGPSLVAVVGGFDMVAVDDTGRLFWSGGHSGIWQQLAQCPAGTPVSINKQEGWSYLYVSMANGDVYTFPFGSPPPAPGTIAFEYLGNVFGATVQAQSKSMSAVKGSYRK